MESRLNRGIDWILKGVLLMFIGWLLLKYPLNNETPIRDPVAAFFAMPVVFCLYLMLFATVGVSLWCLYTAFITTFFGEPESVEEEEEEDDTNA